MTDPASVIPSAPLVLPEPGVVIAGDFLAYRWPEASVDLIFADPPYNLKVDYGGPCRDDRDPANFLDWCDAWIARGARMLRPGGAFFLLCAEWMADRIGDAMARHVGPRRARIIWHETFSQYREGTFGNAHRHLFYHVRGRHPARVCWNPNAVRVQSARQRYGDRRARPEGRVPDDVWEFPRVCGTYRERVDWHPCQVPIALVERCILATTSPGALVFDPMVGSGTTLVAAARHGRNWSGCELNPVYAAKALERVRATPTVTLT